MVFGWGKSKDGAAFLVKDTEQVLRTMKSYSSDLQHSCAEKVLGQILQMLREMEEAPEIESARAELIRMQMDRVKIARHQSMADGAIDARDPVWGVAALVEGWLFTNIGVLGREAFERLDARIMEWIQATLSQKEIEAVVAAHSGETGASSAELRNTEFNSVMERVEQAAPQVRMAVAYGVAFAWKYFHAHHGSAPAFLELPGKEQMEFIEKLSILGEGLSKQDPEAGVGVALTKMYFASLIEGNAAMANGMAERLEPLNREGSRLLAM